MTTLEFNYKLLTLKDKLLYFARTLTKSSEDAEDLLQETVFKALRYREKYTAETNLNAWLHTIMRNTFINDYRKRTRYRTVFDTSEESYLLNQSQISTDYTPTSKMNEAEIWNRIYNLEAEIREPFVLHMEGYKYKEIADNLRIPIGTVKSRIFSARKTLMTQLSYLK